MDRPSLGKLHARAGRLVPSEPTHTLPKDLRSLRACPGPPSPLWEAPSSTSWACPAAADREGNGRVPDSALSPAPGPGPRTGYTNERGGWAPHLAPTLAPGTHMGQAPGSLPAAASGKDSQSQPRAGLPSRQADLCQPDTGRFTAAPRTACGPVPAPLTEPTVRRGMPCAQTRRQTAPRIPEPTGAWRLALAQSLLKTRVLMLFQCTGCDGNKRWDQLAPIAGFESK